LRTGSSPSRTTMSFPVYVGVLLIASLCPFVGRIR
jgi:hypothetical protein